MLVEYYDINKNKWIELCDTNDEYKDYHILWIENINILYIASTCNDMIERLDIRQIHQRFGASNFLDRHETIRLLKMQLIWV